MSKYTPGPWTCLLQEPHGPTPNRTWTLCGRPSLKSTPILIAGIFDSVPIEANARLIAAAPEAYEALLDVLSVLQRNERLDSIAWKEALQKAQAVITKVENGE